MQEVWMLGHIFAAYALGRDRVTSPMVGHLIPSKALVLTHALVLILDKAQ